MPDLQVGTTTQVSGIIDTVMNAGDNPLTILNDARRAVEIVGKRFETSEYFIPDLVYSGEILKEITSMVKPKLSKVSESKRRGKFILGTVAGLIPMLPPDYPIATR